jgi:hypothetical protein
MDLRAFSELISTSINMYWRDTPATSRALTTWIKTMQLKKISARIHIACRGVKEGDGWADDSA